MREAGSQKAFQSLMGAVFSYSFAAVIAASFNSSFQSLMGAVFSYSKRRDEGVGDLLQFQSLMGAVFSYSTVLGAVLGFGAQVSIPDGCSVQL